MQHDDERLETPSNTENNSSGSALSRALLEALSGPVTEEELQLAREQLAQEGQAPQEPHPTGSVVWAKLPPSATQD